MTRFGERWHLTDEQGRAHTVEAGRRHVRWTIRWECDGAEVVSRKTFDPTPVLKGGPLGALRLRLPAYPGPAQEVALHPADQDEDAALVRAAFAHRGDGRQFTPEPGSKAEAGLRRMSEHPVRYLLSRVGLAAAGLLVPLALAAIAGLFVRQLNVPVPDLALPNLPDLPDLPGLPLPDLTMPIWVTYLVPLVLAVTYGWTELKRVRKQRDKQEQPTLLP